MEGRLKMEEYVFLKEWVEVSFSYAHVQSESLGVIVDGKELGLGAALQLQDYSFRGGKFADGLPEFW
jgi:hypothetical protein